MPTIVQSAIPKTAPCTVRTRKSSFLHRELYGHKVETISIENSLTPNTVSKYSYVNDVGCRRVSVIQTGAAFQPVGDMFNLYQYNTRSELTSAERYFGSNTNDISNPVGLQDWSYAYDHIGNRTWTTKANAAANYTANALNQYTERSVPGSSDIIGSAKTNVTVTVNEEEADRQGYYWSHRLTVDNLFNPIYTQIVVEAICDPGTNDPYVVSSETGSVFIAESPESFTYDNDGNLLSDGRFNYSWDAENRLIAATTKDGLPADLPIVHVEFAYDYMSRRIGKTVYRWDIGVTNWVQTDARSFLYDGWLLVQEQSASGGNVTTNWYIHGIDLSGSLQGAGGISGLLASYSSSSTSHPVLFCYDGNGNVSELLNFTNGMILAHYEYSPFGETIVATGPMATENKFRFSTKYFDDEIGLAYYGYRFYSPPMGRWVSRDPIGEKGSLNVYVFVDNAIVNETDSLGLWITLNLPDKPFKSTKVNAVLDVYAVGHNKTLLNHWRAGSSLTMTFGFDKFDFLGTERRAVLKTAFQEAATLGTGAKCGQTVTGSYNLSQPSKSNRRANFYISPMIYRYRFWWECNLTAHKVCLCEKCLWITLGVKCNYHALDKVDFWDNDYDIFIAPPYKIYDQLVRACNPSGRGFDVKASDSSLKSGVATCSGTVIFPQFSIP